jgi:excinuclease ABC subunit A
MSEQIVVKGARENNLKDVDITIPKNKLIVITGLSGSGKSSLAFDTIFAEGQRRYVESLSSYARQFLGMVEKPDVDSISGLSPAISIDQKTTSRNPRSTVATVTEIYDYLRLLYARIGVPHCPVCDKKITQLTQQDIVEEILRIKLSGESPLRPAGTSPKGGVDTGLPGSSGEGVKALVLAPIVSQKKGEFAHIPEEYLKKGFARARIDGVIYALDEFPLLEKQKKHTIEIVVDRLVINEENRNRISQSVEAALNLTSSLVSVLDADSDQVYSFSKAFACPDHPEAGLKELEPRVFSFNSPQGACPECTGLGMRLEVDPELLMPNPRLSITEGAIRPLQRMGADAWTMKQILATCQAHGIDPKKPVGELSLAERKIILEGSDRKVKVSFGRGSYEVKFEGVAKNIRRRWQETDSENMRRELEKYMREQPCNTCHGKRLKPEVLAVRIDKYSIMDVCEMDIELAVNIFDEIKFSETEVAIGKLVLKEIKSRLGFLNNVGLGYLNLARSAATLSGGEAQRIRLATQIGSGLEGVLYVLDEPSIGLHQRDNTKLLKTLKNLKELGNTVIVVEHDEETIREADYLVDVGPGAGVHGGQVVAAGTPTEVAHNKQSITGAYMAGREKIEANKKIRKGNGLKLSIIGAKENNLKDVSVDIPLGKMVVISGVSGSGKSTLIKMLLRMHDISSGKILIDNQPISEVTQESLWQNISLVPQDPILFHRSLFENIQYGKPDSTEKEVIKAAKLAHCHEFISNFPDGYKTFVGERGVKLSGGERQRVAIARAILRNAPILILDEATSSLDSESEHLIQDALNNLMKHKTVIVIAHRLSTIMKMDRIIVFKEGRVVEEGSHLQLLTKTRGLYKQLWKLQAGGFIQ